MSLKTFLRGLDNVSEWSGRIFIWLIVPLTLLVVFEVISRRFFGSPHIWAPEITEYLYGAHFMLVAAYTLLYRGHVNIDIFYTRFSPRGRAILDCVTYLLFFFLFWVIAFKEGILFAQTSWEMHETTPSANLPIWVPASKMIIPITAILLLIQGVSDFVRNVSLAIRGKEI